MKMVIDKILDVDKKILLFLTIICIIGFITGSIYMTVLSPNDKNMIISSIDEFITGYGQLNSKIELINNLVINISYLLVIWILGISLLGLPSVIIVLFIKSFLLSFTVASFIMKYKYKGILLGIIYNIPHNIINLILYIYVGIYSINISSFIIKSVIHKKELNFKNAFSRYLVILALALFLLLITTLYETFCMPYFINKIIKI
jgi:stage II sporulation protein M